MDRRRWKFTILGLGILLSMGLLFVVAVQRTGGAAYYLTVSEFLDQPGRSTAGVRINGKVVSGTIDRLPGGTEVRFTMSDGMRVLPVHFRGIIPDTFVDDADVVVEGQLAGDGRFAADKLLAKCPSKYEAADGPSPRDAVRAVPSARGAPSS